MNYLIDCIPEINVLQAVALVIIGEFIGIGLWLLVT